jgi:hypothetical protein
MLVRVCLAAALVALCLCSVEVSASSCSKIGGTCLDINTNSCAAGFKVGLCPGAANIRCCTGHSSVRAPAHVTSNAANNNALQPSGSNVAVSHAALMDSQCAKAGGQCMDARGNHCASGFKSGLCPGGEDIKCCLSGLKFETLKKCYPQGEPEAVRKRRNQRDIWNCAPITYFCSFGIGGVGKSSHRRRCEWRLDH